MASRSAIISHREMEKNDCKTDNHILLVLPGVQASKHQSEGLDDRKQTQAVGDHERRVETELPEWLQLFHGRIDEEILKLDKTKSAQQTQKSLRQFLTFRRIS